MLSAAGLRGFPSGGRGTRLLADRIVCGQADNRCLVVANAGNTSVVLEELTERCSPRAAVVTDESEVTGLVSIQGPNGCGFLSTVTDLPVASMPYYGGAYGTVAGRAAWVARTGYTGEDGFEIFCAPEDCEAVWDALTASGEGGVPAAGLAARDTLRLE